MKSHEQQCAEKLEDINKTLKELTKEVHYISLIAKLTRDDLVELKRQLEEAKEYDADAFVDEFISDKGETNHEE